MISSKSITVETTVENIEKATDFINSELEELECPMKYQIQIDVAIDELLGNIVRYAYGDATGEATVVFSADDEQRSVTITFIDTGMPYDPLSREDPDVTLSADERSIGGLGIFLVKKTMDKMEYKFEDGKNILAITKKI